LPWLAKTAYDHLQSLPKPVFCDGHRLIPLTRSGWNLSYELNVEFAGNWGYALEFTGIDRAPDLRAENSPAAKVLALAAKAFR
jgi:hypothetical protein